MTTLLDLWLRTPRQRRWRIVLFTLGLIFIAIVLWKARGSLAPFFLGLALAYTLTPVVGIVERGLKWIGQQRGLGFFDRASHSLAIVIAYLWLIALIVGFFAIVVPLILDQARSLWEARNAIWDALSGWGEDVLETYRLLPPQLQQQAQDALERLSTTITTAFQQAVQGTVVAITYTASLILGILIVPFWTFYLLKDFKLLKASALNVIPDSIEADLVNVGRLVDSTLSAYLRGQVFLGITIGVISSVGLTLLGVRFALLLGVVAGIFELIPNIGPILGGIPAVLVALAQDPGLALWTLLFAFGVQQVENIFLTPRILGRSVKLHPVVVMVVLVIGSELAGIVGLFLAPVVTALLRDLFRYLYYRFGDVPDGPEVALARVWQDETFNLKV